MMMQPERIDEHKQGRIFRHSCAIRNQSVSLEANAHYCLACNLLFQEADLKNLHHHCTELQNLIEDDHVEFLDILSGGTGVQVPRSVFGQVSFRY